MKTATEQLTDGDTIQFFFVTAPTTVRPTAMGQLTSALNLFSGTYRGTGEVRGAAIHLIELGKEGESQTFDIPADAVCITRIEVKEPPILGQGN